MMKKKRIFQCAGLNDYAFKLWSDGLNEFLSEHPEAKTTFLFSHTEKVYVGWPTSSEVSLISVGYEVVYEDAK